MRLIDADALNERFEELKEGTSLVDAVFLDGAMSVVDTAPTIAPETLPIVQELRLKLARYEQAEKEGRLVIAPDKLYDLMFDECSSEESYITEYPTEGVYIGFAGDYLSPEEIGKTVFLSRKDAEAALKERNSNGI